MLRDTPHPDGLSFEHDLLAREAFGRGLLRIVRNADGPAVLALDSEWGSGKTYFLHMFRKSLEEEQIGAIYLDAFSRDMGTDAFTTLVGSVLAAYDAAGLKRSAERIDFKERAVEVGKTLARGIANIGVRALSAGLVDLPGTTAAVDAAIEATADQTNNVLASVFEQASQHESKTIDFRRILSELPRQLAAQNGFNAERIVFIVDELDRCRPNFAVDLLEVIRHYFNVDGVFLFFLEISTLLERPSRKSME